MFSLQIKYPQPLQPSTFQHSVMEKQCNALLISIETRRKIQTVEAIGVLWKQIYLFNVH